MNLGEKNKRGDEDDGYEQLVILPIMDHHLCDYFHGDIYNRDDPAYSISYEEIKCFHRMDLDMAFYDVLAIPGSFR